MGRGRRVKSGGGKRKEVNLGSPGEKKRIGGGGEKEGVGWQNVKGKISKMREEKGKSGPSSNNMGRLKDLGTESSPEKNRKKKFQKKNETKRRGKQGQRTGQVEAGLVYAFNRGKHRGGGNIQGLRGGSHEGVTVVGFPNSDPTQKKKHVKKNGGGVIKTVISQRRGG